MTLAEYLAETKLTLGAFGRLVGVGPETVHKWTAGKTFPIPDNLRAIERATDGSVTSADFLAQPKRERAA